MLKWTPKRIWFWQFMLYEFYVNFVYAEGEKSTVIGSICPSLKQRMFTSHYLTSCSCSWHNPCENINIFQSIVNRGPS